MWVIFRGELVMLPSNSPMFLRMSRLYDQLFAGKFECTRQVSADKSPHHCALNVEGEGAVAFVDFICAKGCLVSALGVLHRGGASCRLRVGLRVPIHHLDRHVSVAGVDQQTCAVSPVNFPVCALLFEPTQPPRSDEAVPDAVTRIAIL